MNTALKPPPSNFSLIVDGVPKTPDSLAWLNDRVLQFLYSEVALGPSIVNLSFPTIHPQLRFATGMQHGSFLDSGFEFTPDAFGSYEDPDLLIEVHFDLDMDQTAVPLTTDFVIYINDAPFEPDSVQWAGARALDIELAVGGALAGDVDIEFPTPTPRLVCLAGRQACPFRFDTIDIE